MGIEGDSELDAASTALRRGDLARARDILSQRLRRQPDDPPAIRLLADLTLRIGRPDDAERLLRQALDLAADYEPARASLAALLQRRNRSREALAELDRLLSRRNDVGVVEIEALALADLGRYEEAIGRYAHILAHAPDRPNVWVAYGYVLKTVGRVDDGIDAYRRALALAPTSGSAWWSLADLKTAAFSDDDIDLMRQLLAGDTLEDADRVQIAFALGKAEEDHGRPAAAFAHYDEANRLHRRAHPYDPDVLTGFVAASEAMLTPAFFGTRAHHGDLAPDPVFIVGMPRSGSTLVEQILASHSAIEGTMELPGMPALASLLGDRGDRSAPSAYPACLATLSAEDAGRLGASYLKEARAYRRTPRPFFIDKMPNNWAHLGLIRLILPRARVIDVRRHPLDCGFSNFRQHFSRGQGFSYDLGDIGRCYRDYVRLTAHFDEAAPGLVHRIVYERLVADPEREVRRLLDFLGLPFEEACLRFHENDRAVYTPSAAQVRRPLNRDGLERWRRFEPWLGELRQALGPVLDDWTGDPHR